MIYLIHHLPIALNHIRSVKSWIVNLEFFHLITFKLQFSEKMILLCFFLFIILIIPIQISNYTAILLIISKIVMLIELIFMMILLLMMDMILLILMNL